MTKIVRFSLLTLLLVLFKIAFAQQPLECISLINTHPEQCADNDWLPQSVVASEAGFGNFWPPECGPPGPPPEYLITTDNLCGCIAGPTDYYPEIEHFGCQAGANEVSPVFEHYPWCYVQNGFACPAAVSAGPGKPALRQCGGTIKQTNQENAFGDQCAGDNCGYPKAADFLRRWAKPAVYKAFIDSGVLEQITKAGPIGGCDGPDCPNFTVVLPVLAGKESDKKIPPRANLQRRVRKATGYGVAYAGEVFDGRSWDTLGGTVTTARLQSCPNVGPVAVYNDGFPSDASGTANVPPTPCLSIAPCISEIVYGEGIVFNGARVRYWFITEEAIFYFTERKKKGNLNDILWQSEKYRGRY